MQKKMPYFLLCLLMFVISISNVASAQTEVLPALEIDDDMAIAESIKDYVLYTHTASKQVELTYTLPKIQRLILQVINEDRKVVYTETIKATKAGNQRKLIDIQNYKTGSYFFRLSSANHTYTQIANIKK